MRHTIIVLFVLVVCVGCGGRVKVQEGPEEVLAQMRADTCWIRELDSLATIAIGPGAKCIDPVLHTFIYDGRTWFFNQDWGGVMEIPSDYLVEEDLVQAELSFHGSRAWSADTLVLVSVFAGFQARTDEAAVKVILSGLAEDGFTVSERADNERVVTIRARSAEGINYYGRQILANEDGVEFFVAVQYPDEKEAEAVPVIEMANRYPAGPNGTVFRGEALR